MKRPISIKFFIALFIWFTLVGAGNAGVFLGSDSTTPSLVGGLLCIAYAVSAGSTTVGLWGMKTWTLVSLRVWMLICAAFFAWLVINPAILPGLPMLVAAGFALFLILVFWAMNYFIGRGLGSVTSGPE